MNAPTCPTARSTATRASVPGKRLAIDIADKGETISIDAPGAKILAPRDAEVFKKFSAMCLNW